MEIVIIVAVGVAILAFIAYQHFDSNKDGRVTKEEVKSSLDLNKDGRIDKKDAEVAAKAVKSTVKGAKAEVKRTVTRAKKAVKKATTKKK